METREAEVLIIGAGLSGLAAAQHLAMAGRTSVVLEARDRIGGRVLTQQAEGVGPLELGAEWFDTQGELRDMMQKAGHPMAKARGSFLRRTAEGLHTDDQDEGFGPLMKGLKELDGPDRSLTHALRALPPDSGSDEAKQGLLDYVRGFHAADPDQLSVHWLLAVEETQSSEASQQRSTGGAAIVAQHLLAHSGERCKLRLDCRVERVHWSPGRVEVEAMEGSDLVRYVAPRAIITLPLGVLQAPPESLGAVVFEPPLNTKAEALAQLAMGRVVKVTLVFDRDIAHTDTQLATALFVQDMRQPFSTWWNARPSSPLIWNGWAGGPLAADVLTLHGEDLRDAAVRSLAGAIGTSEAELAARLQGWYHHDWSRDPFSLGAYSYVKVGGLYAHASLASPLERTLYFAGEATCGDGYNATMEGAVRSGKRAAQELLDEEAKEPSS